MKRKQYQQPLYVLMRASRERQDLTFDEMVERTGLCKSTLWQLEHGVTYNPSWATLKMLERPYQLDLNRIAAPATSSDRTNRRDQSPDGMVNQTA